MLFTRLIDHLRPPTPELTAAREAYAALWENSDREQAAGTGEETPEYERLNAAVHDALAPARAMSRWKASQFGRRAVSGAYMLRGGPDWYPVSMAAGCIVAVATAAVMFSFTTMPTWVVGAVTVVVSTAAHWVTPEPGTRGGQAELASDAPPGADPGAAR